MRVKVFVIILSVLMISLVGCGKEEPYKPDQFSEDDMCLVRITDADIQACYGMTKEEIRNEIGTGKEVYANSEGDRSIYSYRYGIMILYRGDQAVNIWIGNHTDNVKYQTVRGVVQDMTVDEIKERYGSRYANEYSEGDKGGLEYFYDSKSKRFLMKDEIYYDEGMDLNFLEDIYVVSFDFDVEGKAKYIAAGDYRSRAFGE